MENGTELYSKDKGGTKRKFSGEGSGRRFDGNKGKKVFVKRDGQKGNNQRFVNRNNRDGGARYRSLQTANMIQRRPTLSECKTCGRKHGGQCSLRMLFALCGESRGIMHLDVRRMDLRVSHVEEGALHERLPTSK